MLWIWAYSGPDMRVYFREYRCSIRIPHIVLHSVFSFICSKLVPARAFVLHHNKIWSCGICLHHTWSRSNRQIVWSCYLKWWLRIPFLKCPPEICSCRGFSYDDCKILWFVLIKVCKKCVCHPFRGINTHTPAGRLILCTSPHLIKTFIIQTVSLLIFRNW